MCIRDRANVGLIRRDLLDPEMPRAILAGFTTQELFRMCARAADLFAASPLPLGDTSQSPEDYVRQVSATTCLLYTSIRINDQFRICFTWSEGDAHRVEIVDYH